MSKMMPDTKSFMEVNVGYPVLSFSESRIELS